MNMQELMRELIMQGMQRLPERQLHAAAAAAGTAGSCGGTGRTCDLYWQGYMAGFYANNRCNQSAEARTAAQAADRTAAASNCRCSCNNCNNCGNWNNCGNCGNCRS